MENSRFFQVKKAQKLISPNWCFFHRNDTNGDFSVEKKMRVRKLAKGEHLRFYANYTGNAPPG
jgi:hypothetical protein